MSRNRINGSFATTGFGDFVQVSTGYGAFRTPGAGFFDSIKPAPTSLQRWSVLSISFTAFMGYLNTVPGSTYGKLGTILAGLVTDAGNFPQQVLSSYPGIPTDASLVAPLFDPVINNMPPSISVAPPPDSVQLLPVSLALSPPVPVELTPQYSPLLGIWMNPSLYGASVSTGFQGLYIGSPKWSILYEDGQ